jgi:hypothetical protein
MKYVTEHLKKKKLCRLYMRWNYYTCPKVPIVTAEKVVYWHLPCLWKSEDYTPKHNLSSIISKR